MHAPGRMNYSGNSSGRIVHHIMHLAFGKWNPKYRMWCSETYMMQTP